MENEHKHGKEVLGKTRRKGKTEHTLTDGSIPRALINLAWPVMLGNSMQVLYNLADTFWLGRLGAEAVAAISVGFPIVFLLISIGGGFTIAGTTLVAQYTGSKKPEMANRVAGQVLIFVFLLAVLLSILGYNFNDEILTLMGTPPQILDDASSYLDVVFAGVSFMFIFFVFSSLLRGYGDTRTPMKLMVFSTILNIILDPFLIFGWSVFPDLGVAGAAVATVFSRAVAGFIGLFILFRGDRGIKLSKMHMKLDFDIIKDIVKIGLPSAGEQTIRALGMTVMMGIVTNFGAMVVAAYGITMRVLSVVMMPTRGFAMATTTMVGQNIGAEKPDRAEKSAWVSTGIIFGALTIFGILIAIFPHMIISIFNNNSEVVNIGGLMLRVIGLSFGFLGIQIIIGGSFRGAGNTLIAMMLAIISLWGLRVPLTTYLAINLNWGASGIWWAMFISNIISALIASLWFRRGTWKKKKI